jgi:hypothetical protein
MYSRNSAYTSLRQSFAASIDSGSSAVKLGIIYRVRNFSYFRAIEVYEAQYSVGEIAQVLDQLVVILISKVCPDEVRVGLLRSDAKQVVSEDFAGDPSKSGLISENSGIAM